MIGEMSLLAAAVCYYLFVVRQQSVARIDAGALPELDPATRDRFRELLATAYRRLCFLATGFLGLAVLSFLNRPAESRAVFLGIVAVLAVGNIPPRTQAMRLLAAVGLSPAELRRRGIVL